MPRNRRASVYLTDAEFLLCAEEAQARGESISEFLGSAGVVRAAILRERRLPDELALIEDVHEAARRYNRAVAIRRDREAAGP